MLFGTTDHFAMVTNMRFTIIESPDSLLRLIIGFLVSLKF